MQSSDKNSSPCAVLVSLCVRLAAGRLHEHTAFGAVLPNGRRVLVYLSPRRLLGDPFEASTGARAFERRPVDSMHRGQSGDVEHIPDAVLRKLGGALCVGHRTDLPCQISALKTHTHKTQPEMQSLFCPKGGDSFGESG